MKLRNEYNEGREHMRDLVIAHIIGFQNEKYWKPESEGYQALQGLLVLIADRYGGMCEEIKG